eukprot:scaffold50163_cov69-Phaeocystis_antarctica.AAC.2
MTSVERVPNSGATSLSCTHLTSSVLIISLGGSAVSVASRRVASRRAGICSVTNASAATPLGERSMRAAPFWFAPPPIS